MGNSVSGASGKSCNSTLFHLLSDRLWEEAIQRANTHPLETTYQYQDGGNMTPLHLACHMNAPALVISALIHANPSSISYCTVGGYTPLHVAIWRRASVEVIREFVLSAPSALWKQNKSDCTPLHLACWNFYSEDVVDVLLRADPRTAMLQTVELDTPLHYAAMQNNVPDEVISLFIRHIPDALTAVNDQGDTALHICCRKGISFDLLQEFILVCRSTWNNAIDEGANNSDRSRDGEQEKALNVNVLLHMVNDAGNTPLHELCACSATSSDPISPECVKLILRYAPETARWKNLVGDYPIHSASKNTACFEVLAMLLEQDSGAITLGRNYLGMTPLDNWCRSYGKDFEREIQLRRDLHCQQQHVDDCNSSINDFWRVTSLFVLSLYSKQQKQRVNLQEEHFASQAELTAFAAASMRGLHPLIYLTSFSQFLMCIREGVIDASSKREMYLLNKAILQGMEWSHVKIILDAYPDVLSELDERSNLYPFMLAATPKHDLNYDGLDDDDDDEYGRHQLDTSFELLKAAPNLVLANMICQ